MRGSRQTKKQRKFKPQQMTRANVTSRSGPVQSLEGRTSRVDILGVEEIDINGFYLLSGHVTL